MCGSQCVEGLEWEILKLSFQGEIIDIVWARTWCDQVKLSLAAGGVERAMEARSEDQWDHLWTSEKDLNWGRGGKAMDYKNQACEALGKMNQCIAWMRWGSWESKAGL